MTTVGVIGLGDIGGGAATSLAAAGHALWVCDVREEATARFADLGAIAPTPAALAAECDVVFVAVVDDAQVRTVVTGPDGALAGARPGSVIVVASTISPDTIVEVGAAATAAGVGLVDCGVSGGPSAAATGDLICMVGGDEADIERARPALDAIGSLIVPMGPLGAGLIAKLARNVIQYGSWLAAYEGQRICEAAGIELARLAQVVKASDARIGGPSTLMFRATVAPFGADDHEGLVNHMRATAALAHKDLQAARDAASALGLDLPGATLTDDHVDAIFGVGGVTP
ncbi:MAG: NAD(P)-dependent oxidoreductase [Actinomycetes bacterium]